MWPRWFVFSEIFDSNEKAKFMAEIDISNTSVIEKTAFWRQKSDEK